VNVADSTDTPTLAVRGIRKAFGGVAVLHGLDLDVRGGEILALLGENGAGKSTLSNIIAGALHADQGTIALDGHACDWAGPRDALQAGIALVHQELSTVRSLSVAENIFLGDYCADRRGFIDRAAMRQRARMLLDEVGAAHIRTAARAGRLGTADQQLVEIAKALTREVRVLMMDEPTSSLTPHETEALFRVMRRLAARGVAVIFISHRLEEVFAVADRIVVLRDGRKVSDRPVAAATAAGVITDMTGRAGLFVRDAARGEVGPEVLLAVRGLWDRAQLGPIDFDLRAGEILGLFGLVGAGRTELIETLAGLRRAAAGEVRVFDGGGLPRSARAAWTRGLAILPEDRKAGGIVPSLSVQENLLLSWRRRAPAWLSAQRERRHAAPLLRRLAVRASSPQQRVRTLSGGNQQKAILGRCLAVGPRLLLLDEPTRGVDVGTKAEIYDLIASLAAQGMGVIFASSELPEVLALATTVLVLARGQQRLLAPNEGLNEAALLSAAFNFAAEPTLPPPQAAP
jgi:ribose transport system ATP-binding protein